MVSGARNDNHVPRPPWALIADIGRAISDTDIGITALMGIALGVYGWQFVPWRGPPVHVNQLVARAVPTAAGYDLVLTYEIEKYRACPSQLSRVVVGEDGQTRQLQPTIGSMNPLGHTSGKLRLQLPDLPDGSYSFRTTATYDCRDGTWVTITPPTAFSIPPPATPDQRPG